MRLLCIRLSSNLTDLELHNTTWPWRMEDEDGQVSFPASVRKGVSFNATCTIHQRTHILLCVESRPLIWRECIWRRGFGKQKWFGIEEERGVERCVSRCQNYFQQKHTRRTLLFPYSFGYCTCLLLRDSSGRLINTNEFPKGLGMQTKRNKIDVSSLSGLRTFQKQEKCISIKVSWVSLWSGIVYVYLAGISFSTKSSDSWPI